MPADLQEKVQKGSDKEVSKSIIHSKKFYLIILLN